MNLLGFNDEQRQALLDLLVMGMYVDGRLADAEDAKVKDVLKTIPFPSPDARDQFLDATFTRVRQHLDSAAATRDFVTDIARHFPTPTARRQACSDLEELLSCDHQAGVKENQMLAVVRDVFKL
jgi:uncharacterized tellurite resistance protein B-like protein